MRRAVRVFDSEEGCGSTATQSPPRGRGSAWARTCSRSPAPQTSSMSSARHSGGATAGHSTEPVSCLRPGARSLHFSDRQRCCLCGGERDGRDPVTVEDDLRGKRRMPRHLDRHVAPLRVHDVEAVVVDVLGLLLDVDDPPRAPPTVSPSTTVAGAFAARIMNTPWPHDVCLQVLLGDQVLALPGRAVHERDTGWLPPTPSPGGRTGPPSASGACRPAAHRQSSCSRRHQHRNPPGLWPSGEVGVQHDPVHAVIRLPVSRSPYRSEKSSATHRTCQAHRGPSAGLPEGPLLPGEVPDGA